MRAALLLPVLLLAGCLSRRELYAEPVAALDGSAILPVALAVEPLDAHRARAVFGLDPAPMGVAAIAVKVANHAFVPMALPPPDGWAIYDVDARRPVARGLAPLDAAARIVETIRRGGGEVAPEAEKALVDALAGHALGARTIPPGETAAGLVYLLPEGDVRLDPEGLTSRFVAASIVPVGGPAPGGPVAGRLRPR